MVANGILLTGVTALFSFVGLFGSGETRASLMNNSGTRKTDYKSFYVVCLNGLIL